MSQGTSAAPGGAHATNLPPQLVLKTVPAVDNTAFPYPMISGQVPLTVRFNLCPSGDPDMIYTPEGELDPRGDSLNWQFHFGDSGIPAFMPDGRFKPDFEQYCRVEHTYTREGKYVAMLSVTDKHQEDDLASTARATMKVTINALPVAPPEPPSSPAQPGGGPAVLSFSASANPTVIGCAGSDVTFTWATANATGVSIDHGIGSFGPNGSVMKHVTKEADIGTLTFTLTATGSGGSATMSLGISQFCS